MNTSYWNLFWTTGMPEAWLMSRDGLGPLQPPDNVPPAERELLSGPLAGANLEGYEIHMGRTQVRGEPFCLLENGTRDGCARGNVWGTYLHGLFDSGELTQKLAALLCGRKGLAVEEAKAVSHAAYQQAQLDLLAQGVRKALDMEEIYRVMEES